MNQNKIENYSIEELSDLREVLVSRLMDVNQKIKESNGYNPMKSKAINEAKRKSLFSQRSEYLADIKQLTDEIENRKL